MRKKRTYLTSIKSIYKTFDKNLFKLVIIAITVLITMNMLMPGVFFTVKNFRSMSFQFPEFGLFAIAMALAMFTGGADLSIVGIGNLAAIVSGNMIIKLVHENTTSGQTWGIVILAFLVAILVGALSGILNGICIAKINIPPILTTLGTMQLFSGIGIIMTKGTSLYGFPSQVNTIGNGFLFNVIPIPLIIFIIIAILFAFLIQRTSFGVKLYMLGSNETAGIFSGIDKFKTIVKSYMFGGVLSAIAGFIILARTNSASADYGDAYILQAMLVAIMGGVDPKGGHGKITGIVMAVITLQLLSSGLNMLNISSYFKQLVYGALLLSMVVLNRYSIADLFKRRVLQ